MSLRYLGGFITASYNPLKVPNPPTIVSATAGNTQVSVAFTAPSNVGGSAITSFFVLVTDSSSGATFSNTGSASPIVVTGLTNGNTYTAKVLAVNSYGPSAFSAPSGSFVPAAPVLRLYTWGRNNVGQLGQNDIIDRSSPTQVGALTNWNEPFSGSAFGGSTTTDGSLFMWGVNSNGQLGQNDTIRRSSPVQVGALTNWSSLDGGDMCVAVKTDGTLWTWGFDYAGALGQGTRGVSISSPTQVGSLTGWSKVAGGNSCMSIKTDGTLWAWGGNAFGQLGTNNIIARSSPVQVGLLTNWFQVSTRAGTCVAVKTDGTLWSWGDNYHGQLGQNNTYNRSSPTQVGALTTWSQAVSGLTFCAAVRTDGAIFAWGENNDGQLGQNNTIKRSSPVQIGSLTNWSKIAANNVRVCASIKTDGTLWTWGYNGTGELGQDNRISRSSPVQVGALTSWSKVVVTPQGPIAVTLN